MTSLLDTRPERDAIASELLVALLRSGHRPEPPAHVTDLAYALADALRERRHTAGEHDRVTERDRRILEAVAKVRNLLVPVSLWLDHCDPCEALDDAYEGLRGALEALSEAVS